MDGFLSAREHKTQGTNSVFNKYLLIQIVKRLVQNIIPRGDMIIVFQMLRLSCKHRTRLIL